MAGGAMNETSALKGGRLHQIAIQNKLPTVTFVQSVKCYFLFTNMKMTTDYYYPNFQIGWC